MKSPNIRLKEILNKKFLQELKSWVIGNKISEEDWKKACEALEKDKNYQEEVKLWDSIDDE